MMKLTIFAVTLILAVLLVSAQEETEAKKCVVGNPCRSDRGCCTGCCYKDKCAGSLDWCPCLKPQNRCEKGQRCINQEVQCIRAPCYPVAECHPILP